MTMARATQRFFLLGLFGLLPFSAACGIQNPGPSPAGSNARLEYVVLLSRHGVRSPLNRPGELDKYSAAPWPRWEVAPGILTPHGYELMKLFGAWDRSQFAASGLLAPAGCADAARVTILADTDQRTRETGKALAEGMLPGCGVAVHAQLFGLNDPLFRSLEAGVGHADTALAVAAIAGRIGGNAANLTEAFRPQLAALDRVLAGCGRVSSANPKRASIFDIPASLGPGDGDRPAQLRGPVMSAATMAENLLLEYTDGMSDADTGWGCVDGPTLRSLMQLDTASWEYGTRTPAIARMKASNLLDRIEKSLAQSVTGRPVAGALGNPGDRLLILVGHDTNIATVAGALGIDWIIDGRVDDTPPGGALLFELWRSPGGQPLVRLEYTAQTIDQMRRAQPLSAANPPGQAPLFVPACSRADTSCTWDGFSAAVERAIDPAYVRAQR
ncbi:MAG: histidine-type phosphatase [Terracidiphilus sp.]